MTEPPKLRLINQGSTYPNLRLEDSWDLVQNAEVSEFFWNWIQWKLPFDGPWHSLDIFLGANESCHIRGSLPEMKIQVKSTNKTRPPSRIGG